MHLLLSVAAGPAGTLTDVAVDCEETATVADLARHLASATGLAAPTPAVRVRETGRRLAVVVDPDGEPPPTPTYLRAGPTPGSPTPAIYLGARRLDPDQLVAASPVRNGGIVGLDAPATTTAEEPTGLVEVRIVSGPGAGAVRRLGIGNHRIGPGPECSVPLPQGPTIDVEVGSDGTVRIHPPADAGAVVPTPARRVPLEGPIVVPRRADALPPVTRGRVRAGASGHDGLAVRFVSIDPADDRAPVELDRLVLDTTRQWPPGVCLTVGQSLLEVRRPALADASLSLSPDGATLDYNRPPRLRPAARSTEFALPTEPGKPTRSPIPILVALAPMLMGLAMFVMTHQVYSLMFMALSPVLLLANWWQGRRSQGRSHADQVAEYRRKKARIEEAAFDALLAERAARRADAPDPAEVLLQATGPRARLWERRLTDPDWLLARIGTADLPSEVVLADPTRDRHQGALTWTAPDVPVTVSLTGAGVVGVAGRGDLPRTIGRWIVAQAATLHSPADLRIVVISPDAGAAAWGWVRWLPHVRADGTGVGARVGTDEETTARRVAELVADLEARRAVAAAGSGMVHAPVLVLLDGVRALRLLPGMVPLLREGPAYGMTFVCLDSDVTLFPEECCAVVNATTDTLRVETSGHRVVEAVRPDLVSTAWCERLARALAPVHDVSATGAAAMIPTRSRLLTVLGIDPPTPATITARWSAGGRTTTAVVGETADGPFSVDLRRDGPHGLVAGTTGSGKSELLQTLIASLAVGNRPDEMTFVLIDYKGGAAFKDCANLPHTVGMVTDLDAHLTGRALESLAAELRRREHQLAGLGAKDIEDYLAARGARDEPMPRLLIVIDEFAALVAELPDFVTGLVDIARRGRSLGVHLLLATQRPAGVVNAEIKSNTNLRIALRVTDASDSQDVIEAHDAAEIAPTLPGRAYARLGHSSLVAFQSARVGGRPPSATGAAVIRVEPLTWDSVGRPQTRPGGPIDDDTDTPTDLAALVTAVREAADAAGIATPPSPWLPPLPDVVTLEELTAADEPSGDLPLALPYAMIDLPSLQRREIATYDLGSAGNLAVVGGPRCGRSTVLRALAAAVGTRTSPRDVHLYGVDCGNNALLPLVAMPHTGAVVSRDQPDRLDRLTRRLRAETSRRQQLLAEQGFADVAEQRAHVPADQRLPYLLVLLDRWEGFMQAFEDYDSGALVELWTQILQEGPGAGVKVVVSGDRTLLVGRVSTVTEDRVMLRMNEPGDYQGVGMSARDVPDTMPDGRGFRSAGAQELQVCLLDPDPAGAAQVAALQTIARRAQARADAEGPAPAGQVPFRVDQLPTRITLTDALALRGRALGPTAVPTGVGGDALALLGLDAEDHGPGLLVVGPRRSGRSTTLTTMGTFALDGGWTVGTITPRRSPLRDLATHPGHIGSIGIDTPREDIAAFLARLVPTGPDPTLLLVDDLEIIGTDGPLADALVEHLKALRDRPGLLVAAGTTDELTSGYRGPAAALKKSRSGVLLCPAAPADGEILGVRLPRSVVGATTAGRGLHVTPTGWHVIQVPTP